LLKVLAMMFKASPPALEMWLAKSNLKKFHEGVPLTLYIATKFADLIPSLKNFNPNPGTKLSFAPSAVVFEGSDYLAVESLMRP